MKSRTSNGYQLPLLDLPEDHAVVNVASVAQRSPFRYPGGKTWLVPRIQQWITSRKKRPSLFVEPFAGGAIVGLTVAFERLSDHVLLVELDDQVAAVWKTILGDDAGWLVDRITSFKLNIESLRAELNKNSPSTKEKAFQTILKNRTFHGGILADGSRPIKYGENGKGLLSRWYPETLARRISEIARIRDRISFIEDDGISVLGRHARQKNAAFFIDPPYTAAGKRAGRRLYTHHVLDHAKLFATVARVRGDFLMTYDNPDEVADLAAKHGFETRTITMKNTHHAHIAELLIGRDLSYISPPPNLDSVREG